MTVTEFFMMGLRLEAGINLNNLRKITNHSVFTFISEKMLKYYAELNLLNFSEDHIALTNKGLMLHSYLVPRLFIFG